MIPTLVFILVISIVTVILIIIIIALLIRTISFYIVAIVVIVVSGVLLAMGINDHRTTVKYYSIILLQNKCNQDLVVAQ